MSNPEQYTAFGVEPSLEEILAEPAVLTLMRFDNVEPDEVRSLIGTMRRRLARARPSPRPIVLAEEIEA